MDPKEEQATDPSEGSIADLDRPGVYDWVGEPIVLNYAGGPYLEGIDDPFEIARGQPEAREGIFVLVELSSLGVLVQKVSESSLAPAVFVPWSAIYSLYPVPLAEESEREEGGGS